MQGDLSYQSATTVLFPYSVFTCDYDIDPGKSQECIYTSRICHLHLEFSQSMHVEMFKINLTLAYACKKTVL